MKWAALSLSVLFVGALLLAIQQGKLVLGLKSTLQSSLGILPVLILALFLMGFLEVLVPAGWVERWLSDAAGFRGLGLAWIAGALTPGGGVIGMPIAAGMLTSGASPAVVVTYLTSMALLNLLRLPMEVGFYGIRLMTLRVLCCLLVPFVAGAVARLIGPWVLRFYASPEPPWNLKPKRCPATASALWNGRRGRSS